MYTLAWWLADSVRAVLHDARVSDVVDNISDDLRDPVKDLRAFVRMEGRVRSRAARKGRPAA